MADLRLAPVDPVHASLERVDTGLQERRGRDHQQPRRQKSARERLVAIMAPSRAPETCEVDYVVDANGIMVAIIVREVSSGEVIARIKAEDLWRLAGDEAAGGLLLERRG
jgi:hypothetical protein